MSILNEVIKDLIGREEKGVKEYGSALTTESHNDALQYGYEETLDLAMYLKQEIKRREKAQERNQRHMIHNHGPNDGKNVPCREINLWNGQQIGECLLPDGWSWSKK